MAGKPLGSTARYFPRLFGAGTVVGLSDSQLLERYADEGDAVAFEALVGRHGPMVLAVCRGILKDPNDAQDAFQATFLVLIRRAGSLWSIKGSLGSWLYRVAQRIAIRANADAARRRTVEARARGMVDCISGNEDPLRELMPVLHEEIGRLPERFRAPIVLCHLQQLTHAQAAQQLGWTTDTVRGRVARARELLRTRLVRRGAVPAVGGLAALLPERQTLAAVPRGWIEAGVRAAARIAAGEILEAGTVSATATAFSQEVLRTMGIHSLLKIAASVLIGVTALAWGASAALVDDVKPAAEPAPAVAKSPKAPKPALAPKPAEDDDETGMLDVRGRVLDPDGKPVAGASIYVHHFVDSEMRGKTDPKVEESSRIAESGADGRFRFELDKSASDWPHGDGPAWHSAKVAAFVPGFGPAWTDGKTIAKNGEVTLKLVRDDVPIRGRVLDTQGRPIAGVSVKVTQINSPKPGVDLDAMLVSGECQFDELEHWYQGPIWMTSGAVAKTDADGRFEIRGVGHDRIVGLLIASPTTQTLNIYSMTRPAKSPPKPRPKPSLPYGKGMMRVMGRPQTPGLVGSFVDVVAGPTKPIVGVIRAQGTGKPIPGAVIMGIEPVTNTYIGGVSDAEGRYRLNGLPKAESYELDVRPSPGDPFLERWTSVTDTEGLKPIEADIELPAGVPVRGRLIDKETGESVRAMHVTYVLLPTNPNGGSGKAQAGRPRIIRREKAFELAVPPGGAMILASVPGYDERFVTARLRKEDKGKGVGGFKDKETYTTVLDNCQAYKIIDVPADAKNITVDLDLTRGASCLLKVVGPDGSPVSGAQCYGWKSGWGKVKTIDGDALRVEGLEPDHSRRVFVTHQARSLTGSIDLNSNAAASGSPIVVRLQPAAQVKGRLVDDDGLPLAKVNVNIAIYDLDGHNLPQGKGQGGLWPNSEVFTADSEGRFQVIGFVAGVESALYIDNEARRDVRYDTGKALQKLILGPGEVRDVGDVKVQVKPIAN